MAFFKSIGKILGTVGKTAAKVAGGAAGLDTSGWFNKAQQNPQGGVLAQPPSVLSGGMIPPPVPNQPVSLGGFLSSVKNTLDYGVRTQNSISPQTLLLAGGIGVLLILMFKKK